MDTYFLIKLFVLDIISVLDNWARQSPFNMHWQFLIFTSLYEKEWRNSIGSFPLANQNSLDQKPNDNSRTESDKSLRQWTHCTAFPLEKLFLMETRRIFSVTGWTVKWMFQCCSFQSLFHELGNAYTCVVIFRSSWISLTISLGRTHVEQSVFWGVYVIGLFRLW